MRFCGAWDWFTRDGERGRAVVACRSRRLVHNLHWQPSREHHQKSQVRREWKLMLYDVVLIRAPSKDKGERLRISIFSFTESFNWSLSFCPVWICSCGKIRWIVWRSYTCHQSVCTITNLVIKLFSPFFTVICDYNRWNVVMLLLLHRTWRRCLYTT